MGPLPADIHMHSKLCGHAVGEMHEYIERGIELGLEAVGFSFHLPVVIPVDYKVNLSRHELDIVVGEVGRLRDAYGGDIAVLLGGEADYLPGQEDEVAALAQAYPLDHLLGSVHFIGRWPFDAPGQAARYADWDLRDLYATYFRLVVDAMETALFDIMAHIDLVKKWGHRPEGGWADILEEVCMAAQRRGVCVELNTAGIDKPVGEPYASAEVLAALFAHGVPITFGSDAHAPEQVARYFGQAAALARQAGYRSCAYFEQRQRTSRPL